MTARLLRLPLEWDRPWLTPGILEDIQLRLSRVD